MTLFQVLERDASAHGLDFLLIGAHAINQYGYSRDTADVDLLVRRRDRERWLQLFAALGYSVFAERETFLQLDSPKDWVWPVDLMFVNVQTWEKMLERSVWVSIGDARCKVPALLHLIALKVHALQHSHPGRFMKDFQDVEGLIKVNHLDIATREIREIFGSMEQQSSTRKPLGCAAQADGDRTEFTPKAPDLDFPVDATFNSQPRHLDPVAMYWRCEELMRQAGRAPNRENRLRESIDAEFRM